LQGAEVPRYERAPPAVGGRANAAAFADDRLPGGPFAPAPLDPLALAVDAPIGLAAQYDPLAVGDAELGADPVTQDRAFLDAAYRAPTISADLLPGDWDADNPPAAAPAPVFTPLMPPAPVITPLTPATPLALSAEREAPPVIPALTEPPAAMAPAAAAPDTAIAAFLRGAGINLPPGAVLAVGTIATLHGLGGAFRAMVHGLRRIMIARASIKGEFRIEQTMIRASGNNPLKFATDDKDALLALLHIGRRSNLTPEAAVADALLDIRLHEVAMMTAMRDAVRDLLAQYNPERLMEASDGRRSIVPSRRKARAWTTFEQHHRNILAALTDDFDSIFGKAFARSYERSMTEAQASQEAEIREKNERLGELGISPRNAPGDRL
jgi:type VI secretion system FHA domain protein